MSSQRVLQVEQSHFGVSAEMGQHQATHREQTETHSFIVKKTSNFTCVSLNK